MKQHASSTVPVAAGRDVEHVVVLDAERATTVGYDDDETHKGHPQPRARVTLVRRTAVLACVLLAVWFAEEIADALAVARRPIINWKQHRLGLMGPSPPHHSTTGAEEELAITTQIQIAKAELAATKAALVTTQIQIAEAEPAAAAPAAAAQTNLLSGNAFWVEAEKVTSGLALSGPRGTRDGDLDVVTAHVNEEAALSWATIPNLIGEVD